MTDVFSDQNVTNSEEATKNPPKSTESEGDLLSQLVGPDKKFKTVEDLAKGKLEADRFIGNLTSEQKELRDTLREYEERLAKVETIRDVLGERGSADSTDNQTGRISAEEIAKLVDERMSAATARQRAAAERERANAALLKHVGGDEAKAREYIAREASRLNMSPKELGALAEKSASAFERLVGISKPNPTPSSVSFDPAVNPDTNPGEGQERNQAYYANLRKKLGHRFYEPDIQQQRMRDAARLGERFYT